MEQGLGMAGMSVRLFLPDILRSYLTCCFMIASVNPAGRHNNVKELIFYSGCMVHVFYQCTKLAEISIEKTVWPHLSCNAIFNRNCIFFRLISKEYSVPYIKQIAKIRIHV